MRFSLFACVWSYITTSTGGWVGDRIILKKAITQLELELTLSLAIWMKESNKKTRQANNFEEFNSQIEGMPIANVDLGAKVFF